MVLLGLAVAGSAAGRLGTMRPIITAAGRAVLQLGVVAVVISAVLTGLVWSLLFAGLMFAVAVVTTSRRVGAPRAWPWAALALATGVVPVLLVIFGTRSVPFTGASLVPFAGIVIGGAMNAHSLAGRRAFAALRDQHGSYEAALSLGFPRADAIAEVAHRLLPEALLPGLDQTRTVGLVTLPGAFVGVMLGGGSPVQAAAAQLLGPDRAARRPNHHRHRRRQTHPHRPAATPRPVRIPAALTRSGPTPPARTSRSHAPGPFRARLGEGSLTRPPCCPCADPQPCVPLVSATNARRRSAGRRAGRPRWRTCQRKSSRHCVEHRVGEVGEDGQNILGIIGDLVVVIGIVKLIQR